jgi:alpha-galactosidase
LLYFGSKSLNDFDKVKNLVEHPSQNYIFFAGRNSSLVIDCSNDAPQIIYWREKLSEQSSGSMINTLRLRQEAPASPRKEVSLCLTPTIGQGYTGHPGLNLHGEMDQWSVLTKISNIKCIAPNHYKITNIDSSRNIHVVHTLNMDADTDVLAISTQLVNHNESPVHLDWCAAATIPIPINFKHIMGFEGHWGGEFQEHSLEQSFGSYVRENRRGRTSHDSFPGLIMHTKSTDQLQGEALGFHLGWSGNHKIVADKMGDGRAYVQMGELLLPGEVTLEKNEIYNSPTLYASYTHKGLSGLSQQYHQYVRKHLTRESVRNKPRPVHYNTWEGIYFNHDVDVLKDLAARASELGAERFVLDDGWFIGRDDDTAGLGDWYVDKKYYPQGLTPLINHVKSQGLEFGLWFEPEMVNPDSDLFRDHPDWVLGTPSNPQLEFRNQLVLDLTRQEVFDYLFERIDSLLTEYDIAYIKWDMNRDINHPGDAFGKPAVHNQTHAFYQLVAKLKSAHPSVEIESCASGGGRADYAVLAHTDRIWTSDSNDALERLKIQKGFSYFFPAEIMGSHVGPRDCHITHRTINMAMRASVTLFGHMGMEMDLRELTDEETIELKEMVKLYKQHRQLVHSGNLYRLELPEYMHGLGIVAQDKSAALFSYTLIACCSASLPDQFHFAGLEKQAIYQLDIIWPIKSDGHWPSSSVFNFKTHLSDIDGSQFSGEVLMQLGMQLPLLTPQNSLIFHLTKIN